jgi:hypothetical protein
MSAGYSGIVHMFLAGAMAGFIIAMVMMLVISPQKQMRIVKLLDWPMKASGIVAFLIVSYGIGDFLS